MADTKQVIVVIRLVRSFEYRNVKQLILHISPDITVGELKATIQESLFL